MVNQLSGIAAISNKTSNVKDQIASAILGVGTAKERLARRRQQQEQAGGSLRWGKTYWQAATEQTERCVLINPFFTYIYPFVISFIQY